MYRYQNSSKCCSCSNNMVNVPNVSNQNDKQKCSCGFENQNVFPTNYMYGQSYVPIQYIDKTFKPEIGLKMGTIFPELVSPYDPGDSMKENMYLREKTRNIGKCNNAR